MLRKLQNPLASLLLAAALAALIAFLPQYDTAKQSTVARWLKPVSAAAKAAPALPIPHVATFTSSGWLFSDPQSESWDYATKVSSGEIKDAFVFTYTPPMTIESGFFALTRSETIESLQTWPSIPGHPDSECRQVALKYLTTHGQSADLATRLREENVFLTRVLQTGYLYNAAAVVLLGLLIWSLAWIPRAPHRFRARRTDARLAQKLCPACSYSLRDFYGTQCPECGASIESQSTSPGKDSLA